MPLVELRNVSKIYHLGGEEIRALDDVSLDIEAGEFISYRRLRDWLKLLNFELKSSEFGCFRPAVRSQTMLQRFAWMDKLGSRYWPILGAVYVVSAVKRVHGMRLISPIRKLTKIPNTAPVSIAGKAMNTSATSKKYHK